MKVNLCDIRIAIEILIRVTIYFLILLLLVSGFYEYEFKDVILENIRIYYYLLVASLFLIPLDISINKGAMQEWALKNNFEVINYIEMSLLNSRPMLRRLTTVIWRVDVENKNNQREVYLLNLGYRAVGKVFEAKNCNAIKDTDTSA